MDEDMIGNQSLADNCVVTKAATLSYKAHPQLLMELRDLVYLADTMQYLAHDEWHKHLKKQFEKVTVK